MARLISKNSKVKYGCDPPKCPQFQAIASEEAHIPIWQPDGTVKYVNRDDFMWLVQNHLVES